MGLREAYMTLYNAALALVWGYVLVLTYKTRSAGGSISDVWQAVELPLKVAQTAAVAEVVHSVVGLVRSPVFITATQVASRIFILWGIIDLVPQATTTQELTLLSLKLPLLGSVGLSLVTLLTAWCLSEIIRYSFFAFKEQGMQPYVLLWLRYTAFIVLYPLGVSSELAMVWLAKDSIKSGKLWSIQMPNKWNCAFDYSLAIWVVAALYLPGFPQLYGYMLSQRRKLIGGSSRSRSKQKAQ